MKVRLALNWLIAILIVPALMRGIHEFADGQADKAIYITLGLWIAGVCCGYALFDALISWMERNARRVDPERYVHKDSNYREV
jgi:TM2 domain-containing membrane protein YozV